MSDEIKKEASDQVDETSPDQDFDGTEFKDIPYRKIEGQVDNPLAKRLDDFVDQLDDGDVDFILLQSKDDIRKEDIPEPIDRDIPIERGRVDNTMQGRISKMRSILGKNVIKANEPEFVKRIKETVKAEDILDRFKRKLRGE